MRSDIRPRSALQPVTQADVLTTTPREASPLTDLGDIAPPERAAGESALLRAIPSTGMLQVVPATGATLTTLIPARSGSLIVCKWLQLACTNAVDVTMTLRLGQTTLWSITLNADVGWWWEMPTPPPNPNGGDYGGIIMNQNYPITVQGDAATANVECRALAQYVAAYSVGAS